MDPVAGNVAFSSAQAGWSFTLASFAEMYILVRQLPRTPPPHYHPLPLFAHAITYQDVVPTCAHRAVHIP